MHNITYQHHSINICQTHTVVKHHHSVHATPLAVHEPVQLVQPSPAHCTAGAPPAAATHGPMQQWQPPPPPTPSPAPPPTAQHPSLLHLHLLHVCSADGHVYHAPCCFGHWTMLRLGVGGVHRGRWVVGWCQGADTRCGWFRWQRHSCTCHTVLARSVQEVCVLLSQIAALACTPPYTHQNTHPHLHNLMELCTHQGLLGTHSTAWLQWCTCRSRQLVKRGAAGMPPIVTGTSTY